MAPAESHSLYNSYVGPTTLEYEKSHAGGRMGGGKDVFNDLGFVIRGRAETGEDIHLWMFIYQQEGPEVIVDGDLTQTLLLYGKFDEEQKKNIVDAPYVNKGQNIDDLRMLTCSNTKLFGAIDLTRAMLSHLRQKKSPAVVFIGPISGWQSKVIANAYSATVCDRVYFHDAPCVHHVVALDLYLAISECLQKEASFFSIRYIIFEPWFLRSEVMREGTISRLNRRAFRISKIEMMR
jgi:hypothetical protein